MTNVALSLLSGLGLTFAVKILLILGVDPNGSDGLALYFAITSGHVGTARLLLHAGAKVKGYYVYSAFHHISSIKRRRKMVKLLLAHGADMSAVEKREIDELKLTRSDNRDIALESLSREYV